MRKTVTGFTTAIALCLAMPLLPASGAQAQEDGGDRCPAGGSGCTLDNAAEKIWERVVEGANDVLDNSNPEGRVKEVKETIHDCMECGMDAIKEGMDRVTGSDESGSDQGSDDSSDSSDSSDGPEIADAHGPDRK